MQSLILSCYRWLFIARNPRQTSKLQRPAGFTLLELLISLVIASIVVSGLLYLVVELTKADKREANLDQVQRDINRAMEYIVNDLQEAVYVYPNSQMQTVTNQLTTDSAFPSGPGAVPVLAFWRIDPIEDSLPSCTSAPITASTTTVQQCQLLKIRQAAYTLVVYVQRANDGTNSNWAGQSRIIRYELTKYTSLSTLTERPGYRDPTDPTDPKAPFEDWEIKNGRPTGFSAVLVDYVQAPMFATPVALNRAPLSDTGGACRGYGLDVNSNPLYSITPSTATTTVNNSFFTCVRNPSSRGATARDNQDVYIFLRGNVQGINGGVRGFSNGTSLPILETQVAVKGVVNKGFNQ